MKFVKYMISFAFFRGRRGKISLWGGSVDKIEHVSLRYHESNNVSVELSPDYFFGASISGPTVNSWSVTIPYYLRDVDAEQKIKNFKRSIALKAHTTGFIMNSIPKSMPPDEERKLDRVELLKKSFPSTTWTVIHRVDYLEQYCTDSTRFGKSIFSNKTMTFSKFSRCLTENCLYLISFDKIRKKFFKYSRIYLFFMNFKGRLLNIY